MFRDDINFDANDRTADIELEVMEPMTAAMIEGPLRGVGATPVFDVLDANALLAMQTGRCVSGAVAGSFPRLPGEVYEHGDTGFVEYQDCETADGYVVSGRVELGYGPVLGLNKRFTYMDAAMCIAEIEEQEGASYQLVENRVDGEYFYADEVRFVERGDSLDAEWLVLVLDEETDSGVYEVVSRHTLSDRSVVVLRALVEDELRSNAETTYYSLASDVYPSLEGGDKVYYTRAREWTLAACQQYERWLAANVDGLKIEVAPDYSVLLDGRITLYQATSDLSSFTESILNSDFTLVSSVLNRDAVFKFRGFDAMFVRNDVSRGYIYEMSGGISSNQLGGVVELETISALQGVYDQYRATFGKWRVSGRDREKLDITFSGNEISLAADSDGDTLEGNALLDIDDRITTFWQDLVNGYFEYTE